MRGSRARDVLSQGRFSELENSEDTSCRVDRIRRYRAMWARKASEDIIASGSITGGHMARRGCAIYGSAKIDREAAGGEENERTASAVHWRNCPKRSG